MSAAAPQLGARRPILGVVAAFLAAGLVVLSVVGVLVALAQKRQATEEAVRDACTITRLQARAVVGPELLGAALRPGPGFDELDRVVRERVLGDLVVRVKVWDDSGLVVYSDDRSLVGQRFALQDDELEALRSGRTVSEVSDLDEDENLGETDYDRLLQVYLGVTTDTGQQLLFETYQPYDVIRDTSHRMWLATLPVLVGGLLLLYLLQAPLVYGLTRRLRAVQDEREQLLVAGLAAADRERSRIASDLHDGVVQGLVGAGYSLSAAARATSDPAAADQLGRTAADLRRYVRELRSLIVTVAPPALHQQGLAASLGDLVATLETRGLRTSLQVEGPDELPDVVEALAYRVAQEAVRNALRHAQATAVDVQVRTASSVLVLRVHDDGTGFDPAAATRRSGSIGLELLRSLVAGQEGTLEVASAPGVGTTVTLRVPVPQGEPVAADLLAAR